MLRWRHVYLYVIIIIVTVWPRTLIVDSYDKIYLRRLLSKIVSRILLIAEQAIRILFHLHSDPISNVVVISFAEYLLTSAHILITPTSTILLVLLFD